MKRIKNISLYVVGVAMLFSCNKQIAEKQPDPNDAATITPNLVLGTVLTMMSGTTSEGSTGVGALGGVNSWDLVHGWNQYSCQNYDYYGTNIYTWSDNQTETDNAQLTSDGPFNSYLAIKNVVQMEAEANKLYGDTNAYEAVGRFIKAYYFYNMTMLMGDVPLKQALQSPAIQMPAYDPQETVFAYVLHQLDTANAHFAILINQGGISQADNLSSSQDIYYGGKLGQWQKLVNSFELRVLVELSNKSSDANFNVPARFAAILGNAAQYPIFQSEADDFQFNYNPGGSNVYSVYPFNPSNFGSVAARFNSSSTYVGALTTIQDPRVFVTTEPAWAFVDTAYGGTDTTGGYKATDFRAFIGASPGETEGTMYNQAGANLLSFFNRKRYYSNFTGDPDVLVGYKEMLFNIAEGIERGWGGTGTAESYYENGIKTSMAFYGIDVTQTNFTAYFLPASDNAVTQVQPYPFTFDWNNYYAQPAVQLSSTPATAISQIVLQKYLAMYETSGYEAYYNWRRTGTPAFQGGPGIGNNGVVPLRWDYPTTEQTQNAANWSAALKSQGFAGDDLNEKIWVLQ